MAIFKILQWGLYKKKQQTNKHTHTNVGISTVFIPFAIEERKQVSLSCKICYSFKIYLI